MTEQTQLYKIKPLEWEIEDNELMHCDVSDYEEYYITQIGYPVAISFLLEFGAFCEIMLESTHSSLEEAKAAANEHYIKRMEERLVKV